MHTRNFHPSYKEEEKWGKNEKERLHSSCGSKR